MYEKNSNIGDILNQAWDKAKENKMAYFLANTIIITVYLFINFIILPQILTYIIPVKPNDTLLALFSTFFSLGLLKIVIYSLILFPVIAGMLMMGVNDSKKIPQDAIKVFLSYKEILKLGLGFFTVSFFIFAPIALFLFHIRIYSLFIMLLLMIYLPTYYSMFTPLILKEKLGFWAALKTSKIIISRNLNKAIGLYGVLLIILITSALPFGVGLIWAIPLCCEAYGIFYREISREKNNSKILKKTTNFPETDLF